MLRMAVVEWNESRWEKGGRRAERRASTWVHCTALHCTAQRNNKYRTMLVHRSTGWAYQAASVAAAVLLYSALICTNVFDKSHKDVQRLVSYLKRWDVRSDTTDAEVKGRVRCIGKFHLFKREEGWVCSYSNVAVYHALCWVLCVAAMCLESWRYCQYNCLLMSWVVSWHNKFFLIFSQYSLNVWVFLRSDNSDGVSFCPYCPIEEGLTSQFLSFYTLFDASYSHLFTITDTGTGTDADTGAERSFSERDACRDLKSDRWVQRSGVGWSGAEIRGASIIWGENGEVNGGQCRTREDRKR